jgi:hypothetical protein
MGSNIPRNYIYCCGDSVLDKRQYSRDAAETQATRRQDFDYQAALPRMMQNLQEQSLFGQVKPQATPPGPSFLGPLMQFLQPLAFILTPFIYVTNNLLPQNVRQLVQSVAQTATQMGELLLKNMANLVGQVISFFFGFKKEKKEEVSKDDIDAQLIEVSQPRERKVEGTAGAGLGGGQS